MSLSSPFIHRPVGTTLVDGGHHAGRRVGLPAVAAVSPLPQVDFPTIQS